MPQLEPPTSAGNGERLPQCVGTALGKPKERESVFDRNGEQERVSYFSF